MNRNKCVILFFIVIIFSSCTSYSENKVLGDVPDIVQHAIKEVKFIQLEKQKLDSVFYSSKRKPSTDKGEQKLIKNYMSKTKEIGKKFKKSEKKWNSILLHKLQNLDGNKIPFSVFPNSCYNIDSIVIHNSNVQYIKAKIFSSVANDISLCSKKLNIYFLFVDDKGVLIDKAMIHSLKESKIEIPLFKRCKELIHFDKIKFVTKDEYVKALINK